MTPVPATAGARNVAALAFAATIWPIVEDQLVPVRGTGAPSGSRPSAVNRAVWPTGTNDVLGVTTICARTPAAATVTLSIHAVIDDSSQPVRLSRRENESVNDPVPCKGTLLLRST